MTHPLEDLRTFKFFTLQHPKPMSLLREIIWQWNRGYGFAPDRLGEWVVKPLDEWSAHMGGVPRRTLQRWLKLLDDNGLIEREPHRFQGTKTLAFLRPTPVALKHMGKAGDVKRLTIPKSVPKKAPKKALAGATGGVIGGAAGGAVGGALDHITLPSPSSHSSIQKIAHAHAPAKGKEGFGEKAKKKLVLKTKKVEPETPIPPATPQQIDAEIADAKMKAKEARAKKLLPMLLKKFPIWEGPHRKGPNPVWHHYERYGWKWATWTLPKIVERYAAYEEHVANWYIGKQGKPYKPFSNEDAEFELDLDGPDFEEWLKQPPKK
jgi:hypothetical protein